MGRCAMCHAAEPSYEGIYHAPKGVILETDGTIAEHAKEIYLQAGRSHAMPPGNVTQITPQERALLVTWFEEASNRLDLRFSEAVYIQRSPHRRPNESPVSARDR